MMVACEMVTAKYNFKYVAKIKITKIMRNINLYYLIPRIISYKFISISSQISAKVPFFLSLNNSNHIMVLTYSAHTAISLYSRAEVQISFSFFNSYVYV